MVVALAVGWECDLGGTTRESTPNEDAPDPQAVQKVRAWLDEIPPSSREVRPRDNDRDLESAWIERGKKIPSVEDALIKIIRDESAAQRRTAAFVIGRLGSAKALDALAEAFDTDDVDLQLAAVESIRAIKSPKRVVCLAKALESTYRRPEVPDRGIPTGKAIVRANVAIALAQIDDDGAKNLLTTLILTEEDSYVLSAIETTLKR